jgi:hypothetical protein
MSGKVFDPVVYKETPRKQWHDAAAAWDRWSEAIERWLGHATEVSSTWPDSRRQPVAPSALIIAAGTR